MTAIDLITTERRNHKYTVQEDAEYNPNGQLLEAATVLLRKDIFAPTSVCPRGWDMKYWHTLCAKPYSERLIIAGSLVAAEIDRREYKTNQIIHNQ